jgi:hypothetical protein
VAIYAEYHGRYVLGPAGDERRVRLTQSPRYRQLQTLAQIELFSRAEVEGWGEAATRIPTCREFHAALLERTPHCPHCRFRPVQAGSQPAEARLAVLDSRLETLLAQWHAGLRNALQSDTAQASMRAMAPAERAPLDAYLALTEPAAEALPTGLVASVNRALHGMTTLAVQPAALAEALKQGGLPCTVEELELRFRRHVQTLLRGHDAGSTRLTVE